MHHPVPQLSENAFRSADAGTSVFPGAGAGTSLGADAAAQAATLAVTDAAPPDLMDALLDPARERELIQAFFHELQPVGPTECAIVRDLAPQAVASDLWNAAIPAVVRQSARGLPEFVLAADGHSPLSNDALFAAAMSQEILDRIGKHLRSHARAFYRALATLEAMQARRRQRETGMPSVPANPFSTEDACEQYLRGRFATGKCRCPRCGAVRGRPVRSRHCWECAECGCQTGLRHGTVMADSPLPLRLWFAGIWLLLWQPTASTAELAATLGICRLATVRKLADKIRAAMAVANASDLLAGLDTYGTSCGLGLADRPTGHRGKRPASSVCEGNRLSSRDTEPPAAEPSGVKSFLE